LPAGASIVATADLQQQRQLAAPHIRGGHPVQTVLNRTAPAFCCWGWPAFQPHFLAGSFCCPLVPCSFLRPDYAFADSPGFSAFCFWNPQLPICPGTLPLILTPSAACTLRAAQQQRSTNTTFARRNVGPSLMAARALRGFEFQGVVHQSRQSPAKPRRELVGSQWPCQARAQSGTAGELGY